MTEQQRDVAIGLCGMAGVAVVIAVLRALEDQANPTTAALLFLLVVLAIATSARLRVAIAVSVAAMLAFNFFLLPPYHTFRIADPENWVALFVFLAVAAIASHLSAAARQRASAAVERARFLEERRRSEALSQRAELASALLASFSHDLRTPVTSIRVAVTNLQDPGISAEDRQTQSQLAIGELDRLTRLFQDILDMARIDAAAVNPERQWVTPGDVVEAAIAYVGPALDRRTLSIDAEVDTEILVDPRLTSSALAHVLENAVRYSPGDTPIEVHAETEAGEVRVVVRDHGAGLSPSDLDRVFEPFYRSSKSHHGGGTGLGLAITRGLLAAEGGRVWCENVPDGGARFTIVVPAAIRTLPAQVS